MLAYRHAFHAGNHADVLKHAVLTQVLRHMNAKEKPYRLVDTHAGAGGYSLEGRYAQKKGEFEQGIARLWNRDDLPAERADYVDLVRRFNPDGRLAQYPGSPAFAQMLLRAQDQLRLFELHPTDHRILASYLGALKGAEVFDSDGFDGLKGQLPPSTRSVTPLIKLAASDAKKSAAFSMSAILPNLPSGIFRTILSFSSGIRRRFIPSVSSIGPGAIPFTRIP
jgi:23S rRNA (adenine2030-N6)-methyltransferase